MKKEVANTTRVKGRVWKLALLGPSVSMNPWKNLHDRPPGAWALQFDDGPFGT